MVVTYYSVTFIASAILSLIYVWRWHKHYNIHISLAFLLIPIVILGYIAFAAADTMEQALYGNTIIYLGGCYLFLILTLVVLDLCNLPANRWVRLTFFVLSTFVFLLVLTNRSHGLFYRSVSFEKVNGIVRLTKVYGPLHAAFYGLIAFYLLINLWAMTVSYFKKNEVSNKIVFLLFLTELVAVSCYVYQRFVHLGFDLEPFSYAIAQVIYLIIIRRMNLYNVADTLVDSLVQKGDVGFMSFDFKYNFLGSNETARKIFPELNDIKVDSSIINTKLHDTIYTWLKKCNDENRVSDQNYQKDDHYYKIDVNYLYEGRQKRGYQLFITDDTKDQKYISLINNFNQQLSNEVEQKTKHIVEMTDSFLIGMATMVESRDNSTGGHIWRTSEGVRILTDEILKNNTLGLSEGFIRRLIKAAPMHDLGKITVDDAILRKPGRFTPEEFEEMKKHAPEGAKIVHKILEVIDDEEFKRIAENVAHYHHERMDGSGYPDGLKGEEIPIEARIMAIADVYDALVSKRVYKDKLSYEEADKIIMEGMGKQFDKKLEPFYVAAREKLEAYYDTQN
ncbi:MAG: HD domain-containing protein [Erysipelotrichaceae bacterium]|nr:HD domain-containing protein [Erysipelotrichaceae bacterium]